MSAAPELSAIVLCYRAEGGLLRVIEPLFQQLQQSRVPFEMVLVANFDADAPDSTAQIARDFASDRAPVTVIAEAKQGGMGWDMRTGLDAAHGEVLVVIDGDAQNPIEDVLRMYRAMREAGADVGKGRRTERADSLYRNLITAVYNIVFRILFRTKGLWDINGKPQGVDQRRDESAGSELG